MTPDQMFYATAAKGFRTGGANYQTPPACAPFLADFGLTKNPDTYKSDTVWSYEVGTKSRLAHGRVSIDASAYHIDWKDVQQNVALSCGFGFITNLGAATSDGVDVQARARPTDDLLLELNVGYNDSKFSESVYGPTTSAGVRPIIARKGVSLGSSPWLVSGAATYNFELWGRPSFVRADVQYASAQDVITATDPLSTGYNPAQKRIPAFTLVNLRAGVDLGAWKLAAFANNLTNETALVAQNRPIPRGRNFVYQEATFRPLTIGLQAAFRY
jgi:outer membrane receptor protein involved in Fe transport